MRVRFNPEATQCLSALAQYYRSINPAAGAAIQADLEASLERIELSPRSYALIGRDDVRRAITRKYAYLIFFRIVDPNLIDIISIRHGSERPRFAAD